MLIRVAVENNIEGRSMANALDLPGCFAYGSEETEALIRMPQAVIAFKTWLDGYTADSWLKKLTDFDIRLIETFKAYKVDDAFQPDENGKLEINAWFHDDWRPLTELEITRGLQVVAWAHNDVLEMTASLTPAQLDRTYPDERWSIRGVMGHIANAEWWYQDRLNLACVERKALPEDVFEKMQLTLANLQGILPKTTGVEMVRGRSGEIWSPRKVLRRSCWHALDHCQHIHQLITSL
jgi:hypothetical protein